MLSIFSRTEYHNGVRNLSHIHFILQTYWTKLSQMEKDFVNDLICASVFDIISPNEVNDRNNDGMITTVVNVKK